MLTLPNLISLSRIPLAILFVKGDIYYRLVTLTLAMISDGLDGFLARRLSLSSKIGTLLDPLTDRFFVFVIIGALIGEGELTLWQASMLLCRDFAVMLFGFYLVFTGRLTKYRFRAIWCGKLTTFLQFIVFLLITLNIDFPLYAYLLFPFLGVLALVELYFCREDQKGMTSS